MVTETKGVDWDLFKGRCSQIHAIQSNSRSNPILTELQAKELDELEKKDSLTEKQQIKMAELLVKKANGSKVILSDTCIMYLMDEFAWKKERMVRVTKELMDIPQMQKGTIVEPESISLLSLVDGIEYKPNIDEYGARERIYNDYLSGEVDAYAGETIKTATILPDVKSIWDYPTFLCKIHEPLTTANDWQVKGYMDISGAGEGFIANCLINTPEYLFQGLRWKLLNKLNVISEESPEFIQKWAILEHSMKFDHIPMHKRVFKKPVTPMTAPEKQFLYDRVKICREWLWKFDEQYENLNN
jgi:hypothetical protein